MSTWLAFVRRRLEVCGLEGDRVDRELLTSAGEIIGALIAGGPAESIDDYEDGPEVIELYLEQMRRHAETLADFTHLASIRGLLTPPAPEATVQLPDAWSADHRLDLSSICDAILARPERRDRAITGLQSHDDMEFYRADQVAKVVELDTWDVHFRRYRDEPLNSTRLYPVIAPS